MQQIKTPVELWNKNNLLVFNDSILKYAIQMKNYETYFFVE